MFHHRHNKSLPYVPILGHSVQSVYFSHSLQDFLISYVSMKYNQSFICSSYFLNDRGSIQDRSRNFFSFPPRSDAQGPTQPPMQWVPWAFSPGVRRPECIADHSLPSSAEVKNLWSYTSTPYIFMA